MLDSSSRSADRESYLTRALGQPGALVLLCALLSVGGVCQTVDMAVEYQRAEDYIQQGELRKAEYLYRRVSSQSQDPELKEHAAFKLAWTYFLRSHYLSARTAFRQFLREYPHGGPAEEARVFLSLSEELAGDQAPTSVEGSKAAQLYRQAAELESRAKNDEANELYGRIVRLHPRAEWAESAAYRQASLLARRFRYIHAKWRMLEKEHQLLARSKSRAHSAPAAAQKALSCQETVETAFRAVVEGYERFFRLYSGSRLTSHAYEALAAVYERHGNHRKAAECYRQIIEILGDCPYSLMAFRAKEKLKKSGKRDVEE